MIENDVYKKYGDIINLPHHVSTKRGHMSIHDRAAQFSPFAALTGHNEAIKETARYTDERVDLEEDRKEILDCKLREILVHLKENPPVRITVFEPDKKKEGGSYKTICGNLLRIKEAEHKLVLKDKTEIRIEDIYDIERE